MRLLELKALLLNEAGIERDKNDLDVSSDEYHRIGPALINADCIESILPVIYPVMGRKGCSKIYMKSGDSYVVFHTLEALKDKITSATAMFN